MQKLIICLCLVSIISMLCAPAALCATHPDPPGLPPTPTEPGEIVGFLESLREIITAFVAGIIGTLPV